jgi:hypothetical protein
VCAQYRRADLKRAQHEERKKRKENKRVPEQCGANDSLDLNSGLATWKRRTEYSVWPLLPGHSDFEVHRVAMRVNL